MKIARLLLTLSVLFSCLLAGCSNSAPEEAGTSSALNTPATPPPASTSAPTKSRSDAIPPGAIKILPQDDALPPILHSDLFEEPVPLGAGVNTAGAEDSAFILPDGNTIYFFFTPDPDIPARQQLFDGVTGIWVSEKQNGEWLPAERVSLVEEGEISLDGAVFVQGTEMWFGSARAGNLGEIDVWTAELIDGKWQNCRNAGRTLNVDFDIGEFHLTADGNGLYFHSARPGGKGDYDIWVSQKLNGQWQEPENIEAVNTAGTDGWPFITRDGNELWFLRTYLGSPAVFMSKRIGGQWASPELIVSQFAAEPSLDDAGNLYFVHHFIKDGKMLEADIYVAYRK